MEQLKLDTETYTERKTLFVDVLLPVPIPKLFTYRVPFELNEAMQIGCRVIVEFGKQRVVTGIIGVIHEKPPEQYQAKYILELLDEAPVVNDIQLKLFQWMADYYVCTMGEALNVALPTGLKLTSESHIQLNPRFDRKETKHSFSEKEQLLLEALVERQTLSYKEVNEVLGQKTIYPVIKSLIQKEVVLIYEEVKERYKPKMIKKIRLADKYVHDKEVLQLLFKQLERSPKQVDVLLKYLQEIPVYKTPEANQAGLAKADILTKDISESSLNTLIKKGVFEAYEVEVSRFQPMDTADDPRVKLTEDQERAKAEILEQFEEKSIVLLHGITGSGKTEVYVDLIQNVLSSGGQVLYLLPEIALTTQIVSRLQKIFGEKMGVYHSKFSDNERVEVWNGVLSGRFSFVVGVRSAVLLPFDNLSLIIVDEEHETSYKQFDPAPRYHARDLALVLANFHHSKVLLGSATPAMESYFHAKSGKYGLVTLKKRYGNAQLPDMELLDVRLARKRKTMHEDFSSILLEAMKEALARKEQVIIFQNRRGYAPYLLCEDCAHIPKCTQCDVSLTYHQYAKELRCHYCGYKEDIPRECVACGSTRLKTTGYGTERLEEEIQLLLPDARVQRMDLDTTRQKNSYQMIIDNFSEGEIDILVGTQMVSKGLDFDGVSLVGILDADRMLHFPDFRSFERTFQLITQVSGRSGRRDKVGKVIIQTANTKQPVLQKIASNDYEGLYEEEMNERASYRYPPYVRLIRLTVKDADKFTCDNAANQLANSLRDALGAKRVLGPEEPVIGRIRNQYLMQILIKLERDKINLQAVKEIIRNESNALPQEKAFKKTSVVIDVDPY